jgi:TolA-binding protein
MSSKSAKFDLGKGSLKKVALGALMIWVVVGWESGGMAQAVPGSGTPDLGQVASPRELIQTGNAAYQAQQWAEAVKAFESFLQTYGSDPDVAETVDQVKPLVALCKIRLMDYGAAGALITECLALPKLEPKLRDELSFWRGVILLQVQAYEEARAAFLAYYQTPEFQQQRRVESILMFGTTYVLENNHAAAANFFQQQAARLWELSHEAALRGQTLRLNSLLELNKLEEAKALVATLQPLMSEVTQIISLHGLTADLGGRFLDGGDFYSAIFCLQRVWPAQRLLKHQADRMVRFKREIEALGARPGGEALAFAKRSVLTRVEREHRTFAASTDFDLGIRMRLGFAYLGLERWREAALVLEEALTLPGDPKQQAQAGLAVVQCWLQLKRHERCVKRAEDWLQRFEGKVEDGDAARVRFLMAQAHYDEQDFLDAARVFEELTQKHAEHELVPEALLMAGLAQLMADEHEPAVRLLTDVVKRFPKLPVAEDASYWHGMAYSFNGEHEACRDHLAAHLKTYAKSGRYAVTAHFRRAYCRFMLADYEGAIEELQGFVRENPEASDVGEARVLIGDALASLGEIDPALTSYGEVAAETRHWYEEAQFKIGKIHKLRRDYPALRAHFDAFIAKHPSSMRLAEAVYWAGVACTEQDQLEEARKLYWGALTQHGNEAAHFGVEDILLAMPRLYRGEDARVELLRETQRVRSAAEKQQRNTLACRLSWMEGHMQPKDKPTLAQADFMMAAQNLDVKRMNPRVTADCADASREAGSKLRAAELYRELVKWHPRAIEVERAHAGLGFLAAEVGEWEEALEHFKRFEKKSVTPDLAVTVALKKAGLLAENKRIEEAIGVYKALLEDKMTPGRAKAQALMSWGAVLEDQRKLLPATAYYERVYLAYGKHGDLAAQAYLARGRALESLGRKGEAAEVYTELRESEALQGYPEYAEAAERLKVTGPPPPPPPPEPEPTSAERTTEKEVAP